MERTNSYGAEFSLDFQFWTGRRTGWYIEPSYEVVFNLGSEHAWGVTAGFLIAFK
jgi:hypothetical protein